MIIFMAYRFWSKNGAGFPTPFASSNQLLLQGVGAGFESRKNAFFESA
jgi:hypothetical protein